MTGEAPRPGIPERIGKYHIVRVLGRGSMGVVYLARDPLIDREVAIKTIVLPQGLDDDKVQEFRERFLREARAAGRLSHPAIVTIYEAEEGAGENPPFIAMEYVEGLPWNQKIRQRAFQAPEQVLHLARDIASALDYAHRNGVVHRDIKPANIIQTPDGRVKLMDFGIAKVPTSELTREGQFLGTPAYMSPEQVMGKPVDGRSDLFSLGTVIYELLTCQKPFAGDDITTVTYSILHEIPRPARSINPAIPEDVDQVLFHLMAKAPDQRYATARQLADDIDAFMSGAALPHASEATLPWEDAPARQLEEDADTVLGDILASPPLPSPPAPGPVSASGAADGSASPARRAKGPSAYWLLGGLGALAAVAVGVLLAAFLWYRSSSPGTAGGPASEETPAAAAGSDATKEASAPPRAANVPPSPVSAQESAPQAPKPKPKPMAVPPPVAQPSRGPSQANAAPAKKPSDFSTVAFSFTSGVKRGEFWIRLDGSEVAHQVINRKGSIFGQESHTGSFRVPAGNHTVQFQIRTEIQNLNETHEENVGFEAGKQRNLTIVMSKFSKEIRFAWAP